MPMLRIVHASVAADNFKDRPASIMSRRVGSRHEMRRRMQGPACRGSANGLLLTGPCQSFCWVAQGCT